MQTSKTDTKLILEAIGDLKTDVGTLKMDVGTLKTDVGALKTDVGTLKTDVGTLKADFGILKTDVGALKTDVGTLKTGMDNLKNDTELILHAVNNFSTNIDGQISGLQKDVKQIRSEMVTKDFLDKKLNKSHGKLVGAIKRADQRTIGTIEKLRQKKIFAQDESRALLAIQLFER